MNITKSAPVRHAVHRTGSNLYLYLNFEMADVFIIAILSIICVIITHLVIKIVTVRRAFWGFPEPKYDKHWLHGHLPHVCIHLYPNILSYLCIWYRGFSIPYSHDRGVTIACSS